MADIISGRTSLVRCNFHPGYVGDPEEIIEKMRGLLPRDPFVLTDDPNDDWQSKWRHARCLDTENTDITPAMALSGPWVTARYRTVAPLPQWSDLAMENGTNLDYDILRSDDNDEFWDRQDWTLPFTTAFAR
ncbi:hypothetical protein PG988_015932 [Apiospora saccharicola]